MVFERLGRMLKRQPGGRYAGLVGVVGGVALLVTQLARHADPFIAVGEGIVAAAGLMFVGSFFCRLWSGEHPDEMQAQGPGGVGFKFAFTATRRAVRGLHARVNALRKVVTSIDERLSTVEQQQRCTERAGQNVSTTSSTDSTTEIRTKQESAVPPPKRWATRRGAALGNGGLNGRNATRNGSSKETVVEEYVRKDTELEREVEDALNDLDKVVEESDEAARPTPAHTP